MTYIAIATVTFIAGFIQGLSGFGFGMIAIPVLAFVISIKTAIPMAAMCGFVLLAIVAYQLRDDLDFKYAIPIFISSIIGIPFGIWFLKYGDDWLLKLALGIFLIIFSFYSMFKNEIRLNLPERFSYAVGFLSGLLSGAFSTGGPPVIVYLAVKGFEGLRFKGVLTSYFLLNSLVMNIAFACTGVITHEVIGYFAICAPFVAVGSYIGARYYHSLDQALFKKIVYAMILIAGVLLAV